MNEECDHEMLMNDLCVQCGKDLSGLSFKQSENGESKRKSTKKDKLFSVVLGKNKKLFFSKDKIKEEIRQNSESMLKLKKLLLILDIDHTLLHCFESKNADLTSKNKQIKRICIPNSKKNYFVKFRPHLNEFIKSVARFYDVRVYTMGTRDYAEQILNLIDPNHIFIGKRCVCRDDFDEKKLKKDHRRLFPIDDKLVLVVDDRTDVWKKIPKNVIKVPKCFVLKFSLFVRRFERRKFFRQCFGNCRKHFDFCSSSFDLKKLSPKQNSAKLLKAIKKSVLENVFVRFSDLAKIDKNSVLWKTAEQYGAKCFGENNFSKFSQTTHFVSPFKKDISKLGENEKFVNPFWICHSINHFIKAPEKQFEPESKTPLVRWSSKISSSEHWDSILNNWINFGEKKERKKVKLYESDDIEKEFEI